MRGGKDKNSLPSLLRETHSKPVTLLLSVPHAKRGKDGNESRPNWF